jgi:chromosome segregation ATPase
MACILVRASSFFNDAPLRHSFLSSQYFFSVLPLAQRSRFLSQHSQKRLFTEDEKEHGGDLLSIEQLLLKTQFAASLCRLVKREASNTFQSKQLLGGDHVLERIMEEQEERSSCNGEEEQTILDTADAASESNILLLPKSNDNINGYAASLVENSNNSNYNVDERTTTLHSVEEDEESVVDLLGTSRISLNSSSLSSSSAAAADEEEESPGDSNKNDFTNDTSSPLSSQVFGNDDDTPVRQVPHHHHQEQTLYGNKHSNKNPSAFENDHNVSTHSVHITPDKKSSSSSSPPPPSSMQHQHRPTTPNYAAASLDSSSANSNSQHNYHITAIDDECGCLNTSATTMAVSAASACSSPFSTFRQNSTHIALDETQVYLSRILELEQALLLSQQQLQQQRDLDEHEELAAELATTHHALSAATDEVKALQTKSMILETQLEDAQQQVKIHQHQNQRLSQELQEAHVRMKLDDSETRAGQTQETMQTLQALLTDERLDHANEKHSSDSEINDQTQQLSTADARVQELQQALLRQKTRFEEERVRLVQSVQTAVSMIQHQYDLLDQQVANATDSCGGRILELAQLVAHLQASIVFEDDGDENDDEGEAQTHDDDDDDDDKVHRDNYWTGNEESEPEWKVTSQGSLECQPTGISFDADVEGVRRSDDSTSPVCSPTSRSEVPKSPDSFLNATIHQNNNNNRSTTDLVLMEEARRNHEMLVDEPKFASLFHDDDRIAGGVDSPRDFGSFELADMSMDGLSRIFSPESTPFKIIGTTDTANSATKENERLVALQLQNAQDKLSTVAAERDLLRQSYNKILAEKHVLESQLAEQQSKLDNVDSQVDEAQIERVAVQTTDDSYQAVMQDRERQFNECENLRESLNLSQLEKIALHAQLAKQQAKIDKVELRATEAEAERDALDDIAFNLQKQVSSLERDHQDLLEQHGLTIKERTELFDSKKVLSVELDAVKADLAALRNKRGLAESIAVAIVAERDELKSNVANLEQRVVELERSCAIITLDGKAESYKFRQSMKTLTQEKMEMKASLDEAAEDNDRLMNECHSLEFHMAELDEKLRASEGVVIKLREVVVSLESEKEQVMGDLDEKRALLEETMKRMDDVQALLITSRKENLDLQEKLILVEKEKVQSESGLEVSKIALVDMKLKCHEIAYSLDLEQQEKRELLALLEETKKQNQVYIKTNHDEITKLESECCRLRHDLAESQDSLEGLKPAFVQCNEKLASSALQIKELFETVEALKLTQEAAEELARNAEDRLLAAQNAMGNLRREHDELKIQNETLKEKLQISEDVCAALRSLSEAQLKEKENDLQLLITAKNAIECDLALCHEQLNASKLENRENDQARQKSAMSLSVVRQELARCQEELTTSLSQGEVVREQLARCQEALTKSEQLADEARKESARAILAARQEVDNVTVALHKEQNDSRACVETIARLEEMCSRLRDYIHKLTSKCDQWESFYEQHNVVVARLKWANDSARQRAEELACEFAERDEVRNVSFNHECV